MFLRGKNIRGPVEGVTAVVDGTTGLRWIMYSAKILPLGSPHLRACLCRAWRRIGEKGYNEAVCFHNKEAA